MWNHDASATWPHLSETEPCVYSVLPGITMIKQDFHWSNIPTHPSGLYSAFIIWDEGRRSPSQHAVSSPARYASLLFMADSPMRACPCNMHYIKHNYRPAIGLLKGFVPVPLSGCYANSCVNEWRVIYEACQGKTVLARKAFLWDMATTSTQSSSMWLTNCSKRVDSDRDERLLSSWAWRRIVK